MGGFHENMGGNMGNMGKMGKMGNMGGVGSLSYPKNKFEHSFAS